MLNALLAATRTGERVVTVEETFELDLDVRDLVAMQCRQPNLEGSGEITLRRLVKEALRMRPDRLVVGEVREAESLDLSTRSGSSMRLSPGNGESAPRLTSASPPFRSSSNTGRASPAVRTCAAWRANQ
ncbi:hypothetical protein GCM10009573_24340 [Agromyces bracchium]